MRRRARRGYSLMETMIAFAVMSAILAVLLPGTSRLLARAADEGARLAAADYAASRLARLGIADPLEPGLLRETYRDWTITLDARLATGPDRIDVTVTVADADGGTLATLDTVRPPP